MGDTKRSQPLSVKKVAALRDPASITANALSYSATPMRRLPWAAAIIAPAIWPASFITPISNEDLIMRNVPSTGEISLIGTPT